MSPEDWRTAALLSLPASARLTGISRLQQLGLDYGPRLPVRAVVQGPLHLAFEHVFLHRTKLMPPTDDVGVTVEAAYLAYCAQARVIDAIKVGDWLLHHGHLEVATLSALAVAQLWRPGADEALWILDHLDGRSLSLKESELRAILEFAGLPAPAVNAELDCKARVIGDLVYVRWRAVAEYEGEQHQEERGQYTSDIDRYALMRGARYRYAQITKEHLVRPKVAVHRVHRMLVEAGYDGDPPRFGERWSAARRG